MEIDPDRDALRALARVLAPYVAEELRNQGMEPLTAAASIGELDDATAERFVEGLQRDVIERAIEFFAALAEPPHRIDSPTLSARLGVSGRGLSGALLTPLKRRAAKLGSADPWRDADTGRGPKVWLDRDGSASTMLRALKQASDASRRLETSAADVSVDHETPPAPVDVYVFEPENADHISEGSGYSSCLRESRPGSRAVVYRASEDQGIVALFDVGEHPQEHPTWRWGAHGHYHILPQPVTRAELLNDDDLRDVFLNIQGRRRLPPRAQRALLPMLERRYPEGTLPRIMNRTDSDRPT